MDFEKTISDLSKAVAGAKSGGDSFIDIPWQDSGDIGSNQFLFFLKPEVTQAADRFSFIAEFILGKLEEYHLFVESGFVMSGEYLAKHRIISAHYGVIDAAAHTPETSITQSMWKTFEDKFDRKREDTRVIGGVPYLEDHPELDAEKLSFAWLEREYVRLGSGTYCQYIDEEDVYLINGFYPRLLNHFTRPGSCIACFVLRGATPWSVARGDFVGATAPDKAKSGSIRNSLLARKEEFGLPEVSANLNGVHLSAGPLEGVVEIMRFSAGQTKLGDLVFGKMLKESFGEPGITQMLSNTSVSVKEGETTFFDLTEELDSGEAINVLQAALR